MKKIYKFVCKFFAKILVKYCGFKETAHTSYNCFARKVMDVRGSPLEISFSVERDWTQPRVQISTPYEGDGRGQKVVRFLASAKGLYLDA